MPKIRIREIDNTGSTQLGSIPNVVYIPGVANAHVDPESFTSAKKFADEVTKESSSYSDCLSARLAYNLLLNGFHVIYEGFKVEESGSGSGFSFVVPEEAWSRMSDKALYDVRFLTTGEFYCPTAKMIECAASRCDAVALIDSREVEVTPLRSEIETLASSVGTVETTSNPLSFATCFAGPYIANLRGLDGISISEERVPASFGYLFAYAKSISSNNPLWYAVAGSFRGVIPNLVGVTKKYSTADIEMLQARAKDEEVVLDGEGDNVGIAINPIAYVRPFGYIIWGNRTLKDNDSDKKTTATSFLNVRLASTEIAKVCYNAARKYTFEQNSEVLWANFTSQIIPTLDKMESNNGILDYTITRVPTTAKARLAAKITIVPIEAVEDFDIEIELTDTISVTE